jgi:hypothetical protein
MPDLVLQEEADLAARHDLRRLPQEEELLPELVLQQRLLRRRHQLRLRQQRPRGPRCSHHG